MPSFMDKYYGQFWSNGKFVIRKKGSLNMTTKNLVREQAAEYSKVNAPRLHDKRFHKALKNDKFRFSWT